VVFSGASLPTDSTGITNLTTALQTAYSGSVIASVPTVANLLSATGAQNILSIGSSIVTNSLGGNAAVVPISGGSSSSSYSVSNSLMLDSSQGQYLSRAQTATTATRTNWTVSTWIKRVKLSSGYPSIINYTDGTATNQGNSGLYFGTDDKLNFCDK